MSEDWSVWLAVVGVVVNGGGLVFLALQVRIAARQATETRNAQMRELDRVREQATINGYNATLEFRRSLRGALPDDFDPVGIAAHVEKVKAGDEEASRVLREYLGHLETYAVAVSAGVFDLEVTDSLFGLRLVSIAKSYKPFIEMRREAAGSDGIYAELEWLACELAALGNYDGHYVALAQRPRRPRLASTIRVGRGATS